MFVATYINFAETYINSEIIIAYLIHIGLHNLLLFADRVGALVFAWPLSFTAVPVYVLGVGPPLLEELATLVTFSLFP